MKNIDDLYMILKSNKLLDLIDNMRFEKLSNWLWTHEWCRQAPGIGSLSKIKEILIQMNNAFCYEVLYCQCEFIFL